MPLGMVVLFVESVVCVFFLVKCTDTSSRLNPSSQSYLLNTSNFQPVLIEELGKAEGATTSRWR